MNEHLGHEPDIAPCNPQRQDISFRYPNKQAMCIWPNRMDRRASRRSRSAILAARRNKKAISMDEINDATDRVIAGRPAPPIISVLF